MAEGLNRVTLLGNLGADPELRVTQGGQAILKIRLATTESYLDKNNTRQEKTEWHSCTLWGKRGEALAKILHKGDCICVEGSLHTSTSEKNGEKRYYTEINVRTVVLCGGGNKGAPEGQQSDRQGPTNRQAPAGGGGFDGYGDDGGGDDIPFAFAGDMPARAPRWARW